MGKGKQQRSDGKQKEGRKRLLLLLPLPAFFSAVSGPGKRKKEEATSLLLLPFRRPRSLAFPAFL